MSTGAFTLADVDQPPKQKGKFTADDLDSNPVNASLARAKTLTAPPKIGTAAWFKEKADRASDYLGSAGATLGGILGAAGGPPGVIAGAALGGGAGEAGRQLTQRALGTNYETPDTSLGAAGKILKEGAIQGTIAAGTEGLAAGAKAIAPNMAESALGIGERLRGRGRTIGKAVLENTSGVGPGAVGRSSDAAIKDLTNQLETSVNAATQQGKTGSTVGAHQVLDAAIQNTPRNAKGIIAKLRSLRDVLDLRPEGSVGPMPTTYTPNELLEIKRGIGKEVGTWPLEWQKSSDVKYALTRLYGAIDQEVDRLAPGTADINQKISSLIPASKQAQRLTGQASLTQKIAGRASAHTGALIGASAGGALGYKEGGAKGAVLGSTLGLVGPELLTSPQAQMLAARGFYNLGKARIPLRALAGAGADYLNKPDRGDDEQ